MKRQESHVLEEQQNAAGDNENMKFEAQHLTRQKLEENQESFTKIILQLRNRMDLWS